MLQNLRDNLKGVVAVFVLAIFIVPLVLFGVDQLFTGGVGGQTAATVNGEDISIRDFQRSLAETKSQMQQRFNLEADSPQLDDATLSPGVINRLARRLSLVQAAKEEGMDVSPDVLWRDIQNIEAFQVDGKFSPELFESRISYAFTPATFLEEMRKDAVIGQINRGIAQSGFVTDAELSLIAGILQQKRDFYAITVPAKKADTVTVGAEEIQSYYENNAPLYTEPEQVKVEYVEIALADFAAKADISEEQLRSAYEQEIAGFVANPKYTVAHILIEDGDSAEAKVQAVQAKLAEGAAFEDLAAEYSDDLGSKDVGGLLGELVEDGFPEAFVEAAKALAQDAVSDAVRTDAGTHFIKVVDIANQQPATFEERRAVLRDQLAQEFALDDYFQAQSTLKDVSFGATDLSESAAALNVEVKQTGFFPRGGGEGIASRASVANAAYSETVLNDRIASELIELPDDKAVVIRVIDYKEETLQALAEVEKDIRETLVQQKVREATQAAADALVASIKQGEAPKAVAEAATYEFKEHKDVERTNFELDRAMVQKAFSMPRPQDGIITVESTSKNDGAAIVVGLTAIHDGTLEDLPDAQRDGIVGQLESQTAQAEISAFEESIFKSAKVDVK